MSVYPNLWGQGSLFAYSGVDGQARWDDDFAGHLSGDRLGVLFCTSPKTELYFEISDASDWAYEAVCSDWIGADLCTRTGENKRIDLVFAQQHLIIGRTFDAALPGVCCEPPGRQWQFNGVSVYGSDQSYCALVSMRERGAIRFSFAHGNSPMQASERAKDGLQLGLDGLIEKKKAFFAGLPQLDAPKHIQRLLGKCCSIMKSRVYTQQNPFQGWWTAPDHLPHRHLQLWDSVFHSIGNIHIDPKLAARSLKAVLEGQRSDGFAAQMVTPRSASDGAQLPILAWGFWQYYQNTGDCALLKTAYEGLKAYLFWNRAHRDSNENFLYEWAISERVHGECGECGWDHAPQRDAAPKMDAIDFSCYMANEAACMAHIAALLGKSEDAQRWESWFDSIRAAVNDRLWDEADGLYYDRIVSTGEIQKVRTVSSFLPLFAGICSRRQANRLVENLADPAQFGEDFGVSSVSADDPAFCADMWREPVWIHFHYMILLGLQRYGYEAQAQALAQKMIDAMGFWYEKCGVIYAFYDSENCTEHAALLREFHVIKPYPFDARVSSMRDCGWSAALLADLIVRRYSKKSRQSAQTDVLELDIHDERWWEVASFANRCSWGAGLTLAKMMREARFKDWERVFAAVCDGRIVGYCAFLETDCIENVPYGPYIGYVFVDEQYRGGRLSEKMIRAAMAYAASQGFEKVYLVSNHVNLYEKYGFEKIDAKVDVWGNLETIFVQHV